MRFRCSVPSLIGILAVIIVSCTAVAGANAADGDALEQMIEELAKNSDGREAGGVSQQPGDTQPGVTQPGTTQETVFAIQKWLKALGCYKGAVDGVWGPGSQRGLRAAIGESNSDPTRANLDKIEAVAHLDVCEDLPKATPVVRRAPPKKVARRKPRRCMTFPACMKGCRDGTLGRGGGSICTYVCGPEIPICPN